MAPKVESASAEPITTEDNQPKVEKKINREVTKKADHAYSVTINADLYSGHDLIYYPTRLKKVKAAIKELEELKAEYPHIQFLGIAKKLSIDEVIDKANANIKFSESYNAEHEVPSESSESEVESSEMESAEPRSKIKESGKLLVKEFNLFISRLEGLPEFTEGKELLDKAKQAQANLESRLDEIDDEETNNARNEYGDLVSEAVKLNLDVVPGRIVSWQDVDGKKRVGVVKKLPKKGKGVVVTVKKKEYIINRDELELAAPDLGTIESEVSNAESFTDLKKALPEYITGRDGTLYTKDELEKAIQTIETGEIKPGTELIKTIPNQAGLRDKVLELLKPHLVAIKRNNYANKYAQVSKRYSGVVGWMKRITNRSSYIEDIDKLNEVKDDYLEHRAESVADNIDRWAGEQIELSDAKAEAFQREKGWGSRIYDQYRNNKFIKKFNKGRAYVSLGLLGAGLIASTPIMAGLGTVLLGAGLIASTPIMAGLGTVGAGYMVMSRAFGFVGGSTGSYGLMNWLDKRKNTKIKLTEEQEERLETYKEQAFEKAKTKEDKQKVKVLVEKMKTEMQAEVATSLSDEKLNNLMNYYQTAIVSGGQKLSTDPKFQMLMKEKVRRMKASSDEVKKRNVDQVKRIISAEDKNLVDREVESHVEILSVLEKQKFIDFFKYDLEFYQIQQELNAVKADFPPAKKRVFLNQFNSAKKARDRAYDNLSPELQTLADERMKTLPSGKEILHVGGVFTNETKVQLINLRKQPNLYRMSAGENGNYEVVLPVKEGDSIKVEKQQFKTIKEVKKAIADARIQTGESSFLEKIWDQDWKLEELYNARVTEILHNSDRLQEEARDYVLDSFDKVITSEEAKQKRIESRVSSVENFLAKQLKQTDEAMEDVLLQKQWSVENRKQIRKGIALCVGVIFASGALGLVARKAYHGLGFGSVEAATLSGNENMPLHDNPSVVGAHEVPSAQGSDLTGSHHEVVATGAGPTEGSSEVLGSHSAGGSAPAELPKSGVALDGHDGSVVNHDGGVVDNDVVVNDHDGAGVNNDGPDVNHDGGGENELVGGGEVEYPEQTIELEDGDSVSRIMDIETMDHGKEMFPGEWEKALNSAGGNETIAKEKFGEFLHDWKMGQLKDLGFDWVNYGGQSHYGLPFTTHPGAELSFVQDPDSMGGWKIELGADHVTEHNGLKFPTLPDEAWQDGSVKTVLGQNIPVPEDIHTEGIPTDTEPVQPVAEEAPVHSEPVQPEAEEVPTHAEPVQPIPEEVPGKEIPEHGETGKGEGLEPDKKIDSHSTASSNETVTDDGKTRTVEKVSDVTTGGEIEGFTVEDYQEKGILSDDWKENMNQAKGPSRAMRENLILGKARHFLLAQNELQQALEAGDTDKAEIIKDNLTKSLQMAQRHYPGVFGNFLNK